jgi:hypothetical protein
MRSLWISLVMAVVPISLANAENAQTATAEYYELDTWIGEYPNGYELYSDVSVATVTSPSNAKPGPDCVLKAGSVIHPWAQKTQSEFLSQSPVTRLVAKKDFELTEFVNQNGATNIHQLKIKKGTKFKELTYLAEGSCRFDVNGKIVETTCIGEGDDRASIESKSPFQSRELFKTRCADGTRAWIEANRLQSLTEEDPPSVGRAEITDFGTVKEP